MAAKSVKWDLTGLNNLKRIASGGTHTRQAMDIIGTLYLGFVRRRFQGNSTGGGDWPPLDPQTIKRKNSVVVLKDTGLLFNALTPGARGNLKRLKNNKAVRVGYSNATHESGGSVTFQQLAAFHDEGTGDLPKREIFVEPDEPTKERMRTALKHMVSNQVRG